MDLVQIITAASFHVPNAAEQLLSLAAGGRPEQGQGYLQRAASQGACAGLQGAALM